jgi:hypothetical protein
VYVGLPPSETRESKRLRDENTEAQTPRRRPVRGLGHVSGGRSKEVLSPARQREITHFLVGRMPERALVRAAGGHAGEA